MVEYSILFRILLLLYLSSYKFFTIIYILWFLFALLVGIFGDKRKIGIGWAFFWAIVLSPLIGFIIVLVSDNNKKIVRAKYKEHRELGEKAEFKGQLIEAVDHYMDSLYHLKNDYKNRKLNNSLEKIRAQEVSEISMKIDKIKNDNPSIFNN